MTGQDKGWLSPGQIVNSYQCWSGGPVYQDGIEVFNLREMLFSGQTYNTITQSCGGNWNERVLALRTRKLETGCPAGYTPRRSRFTGQLECYSLDKCPVGALPDFPPAGDACSASLEIGRGKDVNNACPASPVMSDPLGEPCLKQKLSQLGIPYSGPTSTIRTAAYQQHLGEVYAKFWEHQWLITDPVSYQSCSAKRTIVEAEMSKHGIDHEPAPSDSRHLNGTAFDISRATENRIADVPAMLRTAPACNLKWGGLFRKPDRVHFYTP